MTPDELRTLDARVAVEVMGHGPIVGHVEAWGECVVVVPEYTTSIADAWLVAEKMRGAKRQVGLHWENGESAVYSEQFWTCSLSEPYHYDDKVHANAPTAPLAICLAALKAMEDK